MRRILILLVALGSAGGGAIAAVHCPGPGAACSSETVCGRSDTFFCDDWEDGNHAGWDWSGGWDCNDPNRTYEACIVNTGGYNSPNALRLRISPDPEEDTAFPGTANISEDIRQRPIHMRWYTKFSPGYVFMPGYGDGQKHGYMRGGGGSGDYFIMIGIQAPDDDDRERAQINISFRGHGNVVRYNGTAQRWLTDDQWYCLEVLFLGNSADDATDGRITVWLDGQLYMDYPNQELTSFPDSRAFHIPWLTAYYGGNPGPDHPEQFVWYDNIVTSRSRIGCLDGAQQPAEAPPQVENLRRTDIAP